MKEILEDIRCSLKAYERFADNINEINGDIYLKANKGNFPTGNTVLSDTYFKHGMRPLDRLNMLEGYLLAKLEGTDK